MTVETATYINQLNAALPGITDLKSEGDDHLRLLKSALQATFPNVTGAVTATHTELGRVAGATSSIQAQLDAKAGLSSPAFTGTPTVPTATAGTSTTQAATTAFVQAAIAGVNAQTATVLTVDNTAAINASAGQHVVCTFAGAVTVTLPASPSAGATVWVTVSNGRTDTTVARNGQNIMSLAEDLTLNVPYPAVQMRYINLTIGWTFV